MIEFIVSTPDVLKDGHPVQFIQYSLSSAADIFDKLVIAYPDATIKMFQIEQKMLKAVKGKETLFELKNMDKLKSIWK